MFDWFKRKRHATPLEPRKSLYGRSKMEWFFMRAHEDEAYLKKMPLREYAKLKQLDH